MALDGTYTGLLASVAQWLDRDDLTAVIPDLVTLAEGRIARDLRLRNQIATTSLTCIAGTQEVALPAGWMEFENIGISGSPGRQLTYETPEQLDSRFPQGIGNAKPAAYTIIGTNIVLAPPPDSAYSLDAIYYKKFDVLVTYSTNWLLTNFPAVYLFACLAEAAAFLDQDDQRVSRWTAKYLYEVKTLQDQDDEAVRSGSVLRVRALV